MNNPKNTISYCLGNCKRTLAVTTISLMIILSNGCGPQKPPPQADFFYMKPCTDLTALGRVAVIDLSNETGYPTCADDITQSLFQAFQKKQYFSLTIVRRSEPQWRKLMIDLDKSYTMEQLTTIRETLRCGGILIGSVTEYRPYPHLTIGLRLQLRDLKKGQIIWAAEHVWNSADKTLEYRIKNYFKKHANPDKASLRHQLIQISSLEFTNFVTFEIAETLDCDTTELCSQYYRGY